jgi:hypothetical protein
MPRIHLTLILSLLLAAFASAANKFVTPGGSGSGASWSSPASTSIINSSGAGDTIFLSGGDYGNGLQVTASGVTIRRATAASHGDDSGWQASMDKQATFNSGWRVSAGNVTIDGNTWAPPGMPKTFGIKIKFGNNSKGIDGNGSPGHLTVRNVDVEGPGIVAAQVESDGIHFGDNSLITGSAVHDTDALLFSWPQNTNSIVEYCYLYNASSSIVTGNPGGPHPDVWYSGSMPKNSIVRWCVIANVTSEGIFYDNNSQGDGATFYSNIMFQGDSHAPGNVPIELQNGYSFGKIFLYGNTIVDMGKGNYLGPGTSTASGSKVVNNLWINSASPNFDKGVDNNGFSSGPLGTNAHVNAANPFVTSGSTYLWVKGSGNPPATRTSSSPPQGYSPIGMETAFVLADNSWAKNKGIAVDQGMNTDLYGNTGNNLGAIQGPPNGGGGGGPTPTPTPAPTATPTPVPTGTPTPVPGGKFKAGDTVTPTAVVNVRSTPSGTIVGTHKPGDLGTVTAGPEMVPLKQDVNWYEINWTGSSPATGWSGDDDLAKTAAPSPTPTPVPTATPTPAPGQTWEDWIKKQNDWIRANPPYPDGK